MFDPANLLDKMPDFSNENTHEVEKHLGDFQFDLDEKKYGNDLITRGPYKLENGAVYKGQWTKNHER